MKSIVKILKDNNNIIDLHLSNVLIWGHYSGGFLMLNLGLISTIFAFDSRQSLAPSISYIFTVFLKLFSIHCPPLKRGLDVVPIGVVPIRVIPYLKSSSTSQRAFQHSSCRRANSDNQLCRSSSAVGEIALCEGE